MKKFLLMALGVLAALPGIAQTFSYEYEGNTLNYQVLDASAKTCEVTQNYGFKARGNLIIPGTVRYEDSDYSVVSVAECAFSKNRTLTTVSIPDGVTSIGNDCFAVCAQLTSVSLPDGLVSLGESCFSNCRALKSIALPESVTTLGDGCFSQCSALTSINIPEGVTSLSNSCFDGCAELTSVTLPAGLTSLGEKCFDNCTALPSITLPEKIESLGDKCFAYTHLTEVVLPESLKNIGARCFMECPLTAVKFGKNIERIGSNAFSTLSQFEVNDKLVSLGDKALGDNLRLLKITRNMPPQIASARMGYTEDEAYNILVIVPANGDDVYRNDPKWEGFHIVEAAPTKTVYMTGSYSLAEEITTTTQQMPGAVTSLAIVGPLADDDWSLIKRNLRSCYDLDLSGVTNTEIPAEVFRDNKHILSVKLPAGLKTIGNDAFNGCSNLTIGRLPESVETIGNFAFNGCTVFNVDALPASLKSIGVGAFFSCQRLQLTELPAVEIIGAGAFMGCSRLMELDMSAAKLTVIEAGTFGSCGKLRSITLPETLTAIKTEQSFVGDVWFIGGAFSNTAINFVSFPENLRSIGKEAFYGTPLIAVELPRKLENIEAGAFSECSIITSVSLSSKMESIGDEAFKNCRGIKSISVPCAVPPTLGDNAFANVRYRDCMVAIPTMNYRDYLNSLGWGAFTQLSNSIFLDYEEVDENGDAIADAENEDVEVGAVENNAYDDIVDNIKSEEEQAAEDAARDEALYGDDTVGPEEVAARVSRARAAARARAEATADRNARQAFTRLYSGLSMTIGDNAGYRVKIEPKDGVEIVKIEFGGKDITDTYIDGMVTLPPLYSNSSLKVYRKGTPNGVGLVGADTRNVSADVYNLQGMLVLRDATEGQVRNLTPGIYIYKGRKVVVH